MAQLLSRINNNQETFFLRNFIFKPTKKNMKNFAKIAWYKTLIMIAIFSFVQTLSLAQDSSSSSSSSTTTTTTENVDNWYASPWVWVVGAALFILLLIALLRGNSSRTTTTDTGHTDKVTVTKSVRTDTDVDRDTV